MVSQRIAKPRKRSRSHRSALNKALRMSVARPRRTVRKIKQQLRVMEILKMWKKMQRRVVTRLKMSTILLKPSLPVPRWNKMRRLRLKQLPSPHYRRVTIVWWIVYASSCTLMKSHFRSSAATSSKSWDSCSTNKRWPLLSTYSFIRKARFSMACCAILTNIRLPRSYRFSLSNRFRPRRRIGGKIRPSQKTAILIQMSKTRLS